MTHPTGQGCERSGEEDERDKWVALQGGRKSRRQPCRYTPQGRPLGWTRLHKTTVHALQDKNQDRQANEPRLYQEKYHIRDMVHEMLPRRQE